MRATAAVAGSLLPGVAIPAGLPWPAACFLATLGLLAAAGPVVLRELYLHREVMAAVAKASNDGRLDVTEVITQIRATTGAGSGRRRPWRGTAGRKPKPSG